MKTNARLDGLCLLLLGCIVFLSLGPVLASSSPVAMGDFRELYYPAHCLLQHGDPYQYSEVLRVEKAEGLDRTWDIENTSNFEFERLIYPPSVFLIIVPMAMLPWGPAHILWMVFILAGLVLAAFLMWNLAADYAPVVAGALIGMLVASSELLMVFGNMAGIAISLCVVASWCFLRNRFALAGVLCLAISLAVKPQDAGLVWLCFFLAGGVYRKRAWQTLCLTVALSLPWLIWVWHVAPHWISEQRASMVVLSDPGNINDPALAAKGVHGLGLLISLQTVFSAFRDDPHFYNPASYLICGLLLLAWAWLTVQLGHGRPWLRPDLSGQDLPSQDRPSQQRLWLALATVSALSMLPVYHRQNDAKLLLLAVPACAILWAQGGKIGRLALFVTTAAIFLSGDLPGAIMLILAGRVSPASLSGRILTGVQVFSIPIALLGAGIFYLWIFARQMDGRRGSVQAHSQMP